MNAFLRGEDFVTYTQYEAPPVEPKEKIKALRWYYSFDDGAIYINLFNFMTFSIVGCSTLITILL